MNNITIEKSRDGEYRVPSKDNTEAGAYYTDDKEDAVGTAKHIHGNNVIIKFRSVPEFVGGKYEHDFKDSLNKAEDLIKVCEEIDQAAVDAGWKCLACQNIISALPVLCAKCGGKDFEKPNDFINQGYL